MQYRQEELNKIRERSAIIKENLGRCGIFPDRNEPTKSLSIIQEAVLKVTYELRVAWLVPMTFMFSYCISASVFERAIKDLQEQGYIESRTSKDLGKCWCLTSKALFYLTQKQGKPYKANEVPTDSIPKDDKLILYKCINSYYATQVFETMTNYFWNKFKKEEKQYRIDYLKQQYLIQFEYKSSKKNFSKTEAEKFARDNMDSLDTEKYHAFTKYCKEIIMEDSTLMNAVIKDYAASVLPAKENELEGIENRTACEWVIMLLYQYKNGIFRSTYYDYRYELYKASLESNSVKKDYEYHLYSEISKRLGITRRSILNSKTEGKTEEELRNINNRINEITLEQHKCDMRVKALSEEFEFSVFDKFSDADFALYKEEIITIEHLKNMNVYLTRIETKEVGEKPTVVFAVFPNNMEEYGHDYLFKRLERIFIYWQSNLCMFNLEIDIVSYGYSEETRDKLKSIKQKFKEIGMGYSLMLDILNEVRVIEAKRHYQERYEIFNSVKKALNTENKNTRSNNKTE